MWQKCAWTDMIWMIQCSDWFDWNSNEHWFFVSLHLFYVSRFDANEGYKTHIPNNTTETTTHISIHLNWNALYSMVDVVSFWCMCVECVHVDEWIKRIDLNIKINDDLMSFTSNILCMITKMLSLFEWCDENETDSYRPNIN